MKAVRREIAPPSAFFKKYAGRSGPVVDANNPVTAEVSN
jgi:hypothetical protein